MRSLMIAVVVCLLSPVLSSPVKGAPCPAAPSNIQVVHDGAGGLLITWDDNSGNEKGFTVQRSDDDLDPWIDVTPSPLPKNTESFVDAAPTPGPGYYRVGATRNNCVPSYSASAFGAAPTLGRPLVGWLNANDCDPGTDCASYCDANPSIPGCGILQFCQADPTSTECDIAAHLQAKIDALGGVGDWDDPHVLYFPDGIYEVERTVYMEGKSGIQFVGESRGGVIIKWNSTYLGTEQSAQEGFEDGVPDSNPVVFHYEGSSDSTFRNIVWDGGCADPGNGCYVIAFDESYCGLEGGPKRLDPTETPNFTCDMLSYEDPAVGRADRGTAHIDSVFRNAYIGLRIGHWKVQDDNITVRRSEFIDNFAAISNEDQNALNLYIWDSRFAGSYVGVTTSFDYVRRLESPSYKPGRCDDATADPCYPQKDQAGQYPDCDPDVVCEPAHKIGGDFDILRGIFEGNEFADFTTTANSATTIRDSWSQGSGRFSWAGGSKAPTRLSLIRNKIWDFDPAGEYDDQPISHRNSGPILLIGNEICDDLPSASPVRVKSIESGVATDVLALDNKYSFCVPAGSCQPGGITQIPYDDDQNPGDTIDPLFARVRAFNDQALEGCVGWVLPAIPDAEDPLEGRPVYSVDQPDLFQSIIDIAAADPQPAVVHIPSGDYQVGETLTIPSGSDLILFGDGTQTRLTWAGTGGGPLIEVDGSAVAGFVLRDLQLHTAGVLVTHLDQATGRALINRGRIAKRDVGIAVDGADRLAVHVVDTLASGERDDTGLLIRGAATAVPEEDKAGTSVWTAEFSAHGRDFDVFNNVAGAKVLISGTYMEDSRQFLRVQGDRAAGTVTAHSGKIAAIVAPSELPPSPTTEDYLNAATTIEVNNFDGNVSLVENRILMQEDGIAGGQPVTTPPEVLALGALTREIGNESPAVEFLADTVQNEPEFVGDFFPTARVSGKLWVDPGGPAPMTLPQTEFSNFSSLEDAVRQGTELLLEMEMPPFYDECVVAGNCAAGTEEFFLVFDKVFFESAGSYAIALVGGGACSIDADCDDGSECNGTEACRDGLCVAGDPITCDDGLSCTTDACDGSGCSFVDNCGYLEVCSAQSNACVGTCFNSGTCFNDAQCNDFNPCTTEFCLFDTQQNPPTNPGTCRYCSSGSCS